QVVWAPAGPSYSRPRCPPSPATSATNSPSDGARSGTGAFFVTHHTDCHSAAVKNRSHGTSGYVRPSHVTYNTRQATIRYSARHGCRRSVVSSCRSSTLQPLLYTRINTSICHLQQ